MQAISLSFLDVYGLVIRILINFGMVFLFVAIFMVFPTMFFDLHCSLFSVCGTKLPPVAPGQRLQPQLSFLRSGANVIKLFTAVSYEFS